MNSDQEFRSGSYCTKCGNALGVTSIFCSQCGARREQHVSSNAEEAPKDAQTGGTVQLKEPKRIDSRLTSAVWVIALGLALVMFKLGTFDDEIRLVSGNLSSLSIVLGAIFAALGLSTLLFFKRRQVSTRFIESQTNPASPPPSHSTASETL